MPFQNALALVVRGTDWSETSRISTLFTREYGKVRGLAKGGRRLQSGFEIAFDLLSVCHVTFIHKGNGGLDLLTEAQLVERFPVLRTNLKALYCGYYIAELLADGTQDGDPHPELFDTALTQLRGLNAGQPPWIAACRFELAWLTELGYTPRLDACASCGNVEYASPDSVGLIFGPTAGGLLCPTCRVGVADRLLISEDARQMLVDWLAETPHNPPADLEPEFRRLLGRCVCSVLGRRPKLLGYLEPPGT